MTKTAIAVLWTTLFLSPAIASPEVPLVQSPQDQACRDEAKSRVFSEPTGGQDLFVIGRRYWTECMRRAERAKRPTRVARR